MGTRCGRRCAINNEFGARSRSATPQSFQSWGDWLALGSAGRSRWEWGASACVEMGGVVECFTSESTLLATHPHLDQRSTGRYTLRASRSSALRLYRQSHRRGNVLYLTTRSVVHNLASYGFNDDTSSYQVGRRSAQFFSGSYAGGAVYPGTTYAYASSNTMLLGWNDVVSSVIIH